MNTPRALVLVLLVGVGLAATLGGRPAPVHAAPPYGPSQLLTTVRPINAVVTSAEATVVNAVTGKKLRFLSAKIAADTAGTYVFQPASSTTDVLVTYLVANTPTDLDLGPDGFRLAAATALQCDGPSGSILSGYFVAVEEN